MYHEVIRNAFEELKSMMQNFLCLSLITVSVQILYKHRWKIELFFKWIQHLKIQRQIIKTQIWIAISTYVTIAKKRFNLNQSLYAVFERNH